jgi:hypothetical protein
MDETKRVTYADKDASWELYVELNTKMTTQSINQSYFGDLVVGDNKSTLDSIYSIFPETRDILKRYGHQGKQFANLAFKMLNVVIRPFTTKWHTSNLYSNDFQEELKMLQSDLIPYVDKFLEMANTKNKLLDKVEE